MKLQNKVALITGGSKGIGKAIAERFIKEGAKVIIFGIEKPSYKTEFYNVDVSNEEEIKKAVKNISKLDILVNNAGIYFHGLVEDTEKKDLDRIIDINFKGPYLMSKHLIPLLRSVFNSEKELKDYANTNPMKKIGKPEDVANLAVFLASEEANYISGGLYSVDGGEATSSVHSK